MDHEIERMGKEQKELNNWERNREQKVEKRIYTGNRKKGWKKLMKLSYIYIWKLPSVAEIVLHKAETVLREAETVPNVAETAPGVAATVPREAENVPRVAETVPDIAETVLLEGETVPCKTEIVPHKAETGSRGLHPNFIWLIWLLMLISVAKTECI